MPNNTELKVTIRTIVAEALERLAGEEDLAGLARMSADFGSTFHKLINVPDLGVALREVAGEINQTLDQFRIAEEEIEQRINWLENGLQEARTDLMMVRTKIPGICPWCGRGSSTCKATTEDACTP